MAKVGRCPPEVPMPAKWPTHPQYPQLESCDHYLYLVVLAVYWRAVGGCWWLRQPRKSHRACKPCLVPCCASLLLTNFPLLPMFFLSGRWSVDCSLLQIKTTTLQDSTVKRYEGEAGQCKIRIFPQPCKNSTVHRFRGEHALKVIFMGDPIFSIS